MVPGQFQANQRKSVTVRQTDKYMKVISVTACIFSPEVLNFLSLHEDFWLAPVAALGLVCPHRAKEVDSVSCNKENNRYAVLRNSVNKKW